MDELRKHAMVLKNRGNYKEALQLLRQAYVGMLGNSSAAEIGRVIIELGDIQRLLDDEESIFRYYGAYDIATRIKDDELRAMAMNGLASHHVKVRDFKQAYKMFEDALALMLHDREYSIEIRCNMVNVLEQMGELAKAEQMIRICVEEAGDSITVLYAAASVYHAMGNDKKAWSLLKRLFNIVKQGENNVFIAAVLEAMAAIMGDNGYAQEALILDTKAYKIYKQTFPPTNDNIQHLLQSMDYHLHTARGWMFWRTYEHFVPQHALPIEFLEDIITKVQL